MKITSDWPLPPLGIRFLTPQFVQTQLAGHPLTEGLFPIAMGYYPAAFGHRMQRQQQDSYLLIYCIDGKGTLMCDDKRYRINSGDIILLPPNHPHAYKADTKDPWTIYWLHFNGRLADHFYQHIQMSTPSFNIGVQPRVVRIFDGLSEPNTFKAGINCKHCSATLPCWYVNSDPKVVKRLTGKDCAPPCKSTFTVSSISTSWQLVQNCRNTTSVRNLKPIPASRRYSTLLI